MTSGRICAGAARSGRPAAARRRRRLFTRRHSASRSDWLPRRWRTLASAAAAVAGGRAVVKMKPGAWLRTKSTSSRRPVTKPPTTPKALPSPPCTMSTWSQQALGLQQAAALGAMHADRMRLVDVGQRTVAARHRQQGAQRRDVAVHRVQRLEGHQLRPVGIERRESRVEVRGIVVREDHGLGTAAPDALDHRRMVVGVREHHATRQRGGEGRQHGVVGDVTGGEHQRRVLAVQRGELRLQRDDRIVGTGDVAGAAGAGAVARRARCGSPRAPAGGGSCRGSRCCTRR